jgi:hypothetical protein
MIGRTFSGATENFFLGFFLLPSLLPPLLVTELFLSSVSNCGLLLLLLVFLVALDFLPDLVGFFLDFSQSESESAAPFISASEEEEGARLDRLFSFFDGFSRAETKN